VKVGNIRIVECNRVIGCYAFGDDEADAERVIGAMTMRLGRCKFFNLKDVNSDFGDRDMGSTCEWRQRLTRRDD
jgi:hypothetical protein